MNDTVLNFLIYRKTEPCDEMRDCELCAEPIFLNQVILGIRPQNFDGDDIPVMYFCQSCGELPIMEVYRG